MIRTLFILDFDGTYDNEDENDYGVEPSVYLIPLDRQLDVERIAYAASKEFNENADGSDMCIGDLFEEKLKSKGIEFHQVEPFDVLIAHSSTHNEVFPCATGTISGNAIFSAPANSKFKFFNTSGLRIVTFM